MRRAEEALPCRGATGTRSPRHRRLDAGGTGDGRLRHRRITVAALAPRSRLQISLLRGWARSLLPLAGFRVQVEGCDGLDTSQRFVVMANHASRLDIPTLLVALPRELDVRFLAKRSLFRVPFLGWAMRAVGFVAVESRGHLNRPRRVRRGSAPSSSAVGRCSSSRRRRPLAATSCCPFAAAASCWPSRAAWRCCRSASSAPRAGCRRAGSFSGPDRWWSASAIRSPPPP